MPKSLTLAFAWHLPLPGPPISILAVRVWVGGMSSWSWRPVLPAEAGACRVTGTPQGAGWVLRAGRALLSAVVLGA